MLRNKLKFNLFKYYKLFIFSAFIGNLIKNGLKTKALLIFNLLLNLIKLKFKVNPFLKLFFVIQRIKLPIFIQSRLLPGRKRKSRKIRMPVYFIFNFKAYNWTIKIILQSVLNKASIKGFVYDLYNEFIFLESGLSCVSFDKLQSLLYESVDLVYLLKKKKKNRGFSLDLLKFFKMEFSKKLFYSEEVKFFSKASVPEYFDIISRTDVNKKNFDKLNITLLIVYNNLYFKLQKFILYYNSLVFSNFWFKFNFNNIFLFKYRLLFFWFKFYIVNLFLKLNFFKLLKFHINSPFFSNKKYLSKIIFLSKFNLIDSKLKLQRFYSNYISRSTDFYIFDNFLLYINLLKKKINFFLFSYSRSFFNLIGSVFNKKSFTNVLNFILNSRKIKKSLNKDNTYIQAAEFRFYLIFKKSFFLLKFKDNFINFNFIKYNDFNPFFIYSNNEINGLIFFFIHFVYGNYLRFFKLYIHFILTLLLQSTKEKLLFLTNFANLNLDFKLFSLRFVFLFFLYFKSIFKSKYKVKAISFNNFIFLIFNNLLFNFSQNIEFYGINLNIFNFYYYFKFYKFSFVNIFKNNNKKYLKVISNIFYFKFFLYNFLFFVLNLKHNTLISPFFKTHNKLWLFNSFNFGKLINKNYINLYSKSNIDLNLIPKKFNLFFLVFGFCFNFSIFRKETLGLLRDFFKADLSLFSGFFYFNFFYKHRKKLNRLNKRVLRIFNLFRFILSIFYKFIFFFDIYKIKFLLRNFFVGSHFKLKLNIIFFKFFLEKFHVLMRKYFFYAFRRFAFNYSGLVSLYLTSKCIKKNKLHLYSTFGFLKYIKSKLLVKNQNIRKKINFNKPKPLFKNQNTRKKINFSRKGFRFFFNNKSKRKVREKNIKIK